MHVISVYFSKNLNFMEIYPVYINCYKIKPKQLQ